MMKKNKTFEDIMYYVEYTPHEYRIEFKAYQCSIDLSTGKAFGFSPERSDPIDDWSKARCELEGSIKWDGCANFLHPEEKDCMQHCCSIEDRRNYLELWERLYEIAKAEIPGNII